MFVNSLSKIYSKVVSMRNNMHDNTTSIMLRIIYELNQHDAYAIKDIYLILC